MNNEMLIKYARLTVEVGLNVQRNKTLVINSPIECADFVRAVAAVAYDNGAREVVMNWEDELINHMKFMRADEEVFNEFPDWEKDFYTHYLHKDAAFLIVYVSDLDLMNDVDPQRIADYFKVKSAALSEYLIRRSNFLNAWSAVAVPTKAWARKVYPQLSDDQALKKLWDDVFSFVKLKEDDPVKAWRKHIDDLKGRSEFLNNQRIKSLHFKNSFGTDLTVALDENHKWVGGSAYLPDGTEFLPNMPTEEICTFPKKFGVNGVVISAMPLIIKGGEAIDKFCLTLKDGKIVNYKAVTGLESLKRLIETDEGSCYLGEVALVPIKSPIAQAHQLFWNTLIDENASCHLAIGNAYLPTLEGGADMDKDQLTAHGFNRSIVHQDFMIGTADMEITGINKENRKIMLMKDGDFVF